MASPPTLRNGKDGIEMNRHTTALEILRGGTVIPAIPLALDENRRFDEAGQRRLIRYYLACGVGGVICHISASWFPPEICDIGLERYDRLVEYAGGKGVKIAFENLRKIGNVAYFADRYEGADNVVFCYDCGHEHCYTQTVCFPDIFRDRMAYTHIHDNFGRSKDDYYGDPDLHLMPFDGEIDYSRVVRKLDEYGYEGSLTLEVSNSVYPDESRESFIARAYDAIIRISHM